MIQEIELTLKEVIVETSDTKTLVFERPKDLEFEAGQFFAFEIECEKETLNRSYSTSSSPLDETIEFTVKEIPDGKCSRLLCCSKPGDKFKIKGPLGQFVLTEKEEKDVVFICGGSGVSAFRGMLRYAFKKGMKNKFDLFYSVRLPDQIIFAKELKDMESKHDNFKMFITCTRIENEKWSGLRGRFSIELIKEKVGSLKGKVFYLCGGPEIVQTFEDALKKEGVEDIRKERFY